MPPSPAHHGVGTVQQAHHGQQEPPPPVRLEPARAALCQQARRLAPLHRGWDRLDSTRPDSTRLGPAPLCASRGGPGPLPPRPGRRSGRGAGERPAVFKAAGGRREDRGYFFAPALMETTSAARSAERMAMNARCWYVLAAPALLG